MVRGGRFEAGVGLSEVRDGVASEPRRARPYRSGVKRLAVIVVVLVALGVVATWLLTRPRAAAASEVLAWSGNLEPDLVRAVLIRWPDGTKASLTRAPVGDGWLMTLGDEPAWPVPATRVRAALRLIGQASGPSESDRLRSFPIAPPPNIAVTITIGDRNTRVVHIAPGALGGRVRMWVEGGPENSGILAEAGIAKIFELEGVATWGEPTLLVGFGEPARAAISSAGGGIELSRTQTRWSLLKPMLARADATSCRVVMQRWGEVQATRWVSGSESAEMGFAAPFAALREETEARRASGEEVTRARVVQEVTIGASAGAGARYVRAEGWSEDGAGARTSHWGPRIGLVSQTDADTFNITSAGLLTRRAADIAGADVKFVSLARGDATGDVLAATRTIDGWKQGSVPLSGADAAGVQGLIRLCCETDAATVVTDSPAGLKHLATVRLGVSRDASVELTVSRAQVPLKEGNQPVLLVSDGKVTWMYPEGAWGEVVRWVAG